MSVGVSSRRVKLQTETTVPTEPIWRLTVDQYHEMITAGILTDDDPVELLEGWLVLKMPKHPPHRVATRLTQKALDRILPPGWDVSVQDPITTDTSEPEPDVSVARGDTRDYVDHHPGPKDVAIAIEVSESSLARDRGLKKRIYARARIPVYWIINLIDRRVEVYSNPSGPTKKPDYRRIQVLDLGDDVPLVIDGRTVGVLKVRDLLP
jgi:Uma2 family endonuclease